MTAQEILEGIARHRANPVRLTLNLPANTSGATQDVAVNLSHELDRKINEIEWALQALAELLRDQEQQIIDVVIDVHRLQDAASLRDREET